MVLTQLQEPNVSFGSAPSWTTGANYTQAAVDFAINRAYGKLLDDLGDISLVTQVLSFASVVQQYAYPIPVGQTASGTVSTSLVTSTTPTGVVLTLTINGTATTYTCVSTDGALSAITNLVTKVNASSLVTATNPTINALQLTLNAASQYTITAYTAGTAGNSITLTASSSNSAIMSISVSGSTLTGGTAASPNIRKVRSVYYQPLGLSYNVLREPGVRLVSWAEYQRQTASGYLQYFSAGSIPDFVAVNTLRTQLWLYPSPYESGDTITMEYCPQLTNSTSVSAANWGYLSNATDSPPSMLPEDIQDCIWMYACYLLWPKSREIGTAQAYLQMYKDKLQESKANYMDASAGASFGIRSRDDMLAISYGVFSR